MTKAEHDKSEQMLWRMAIIKIFLFSAVSLWTCWSTATQGLDMTKLGTWEWIQTVGGCVAAWFITLMAFVDKSAGQISSGKIPGLENGKIEEPTETETKIP